MSEDLVHLTEIHNGEKRWSPFSEGEMSRRREAIRVWMGEQGVDACLFTSYHCIAYYSGFLYCGFGRNYGLVIGEEQATVITALVDGGYTWRRTVGCETLTYSDWRRDNYFRAASQLLQGAKRVGIEFDHMSLTVRAQLEGVLSGVEFCDVSEASMWRRTIKSAEEVSLIGEGTRICNVGGRAGIAAVRAGVAEHEVARASTNAMETEMTKTFPSIDVVNNWTWVQSGINTDGAHNPSTNRKIEAGDILSMNCFPMLFGYYTALERTLFCERASDAELRIWEKNCEVHRRGLELLQPGAKCCDVAQELNAMYEEWDLLRYRTFGYGHSFGVLCHYYGREAGVELRENVETKLEAGMVVSMEPMLMIREGERGAGGYREHDIIVIEEKGNRNLTDFPFGPEHHIIAP